MTQASDDDTPGTETNPDELATTSSGSAAFLVTIGDIGVTPDWIVTPNGNAPIAGSQWIVSDMSRTESRMPAWAIVCAILFALACLIGLLFLLVKESHTTGYVEVVVRSGELYHKTQIPISNPAQVQQVRALVNQAQTVAAQAKR